MKCAAVFTCAAFLIPLGSSIRTEDVGMHEGGAHGDPLTVFATGKWCDQNNDEDAGVADEGFALEQCQKACEDDESCLFVCFDSNAGWCATYKTCSATDRPNDFDQDTSGWTIWQKVKDGDKLTEEMRENEVLEDEPEKVKEVIPDPENEKEIPECECAKGKYQKGSAPGDIMCAFQRGKNCARSKDGSCPPQAVKCRKGDEKVSDASDLSSDDKEREAPGIKLPLCTCKEDKYQKGSQSGDTMCAFQGGKNCALSKGSCPEGRAVACMKP